MIYLSELFGRLIEFLYNNSLEFFCCCRHRRRHRRPRRRRRRRRCWLKLMNREIMT